MSRITSMTPLNAIATKDSLGNIVRKVDCELYSIRLVPLSCLRWSPPYDSYER